MSARREETFDLTEGHLRLLSSAYVRWSEMEWGAPEIDGKRPYGNGEIHEDIAAILGREDLLDESGSVDDEAHRRLLFDFHRQTETALQIVLQHRTFEPGRFTRAKYASRWTRVV